MKNFWKKRKISLIVILLVWAASLLMASANGDRGHISLIVNEAPVVFDDLTGIPYLADTGRTMMPLRVCLNAIGCQVDWDQESKCVTAIKGDAVVKIPVGANVITALYKQVPIDTPAIVRDGRTYVPIRCIYEAFGYGVEWENTTKTVLATELTPSQINGGKTGAFSRRQLNFTGFDGIQGDITLPVVSIAEKGDCPYVYFGFDWIDDKGNAEGGFQYIEDEKSANYNTWTVFLRQGNDWRWGDNIVLEPGSTHHIKFYSHPVSDTRTELVIELDGKVVVRKDSDATDFSAASVKAVVSMAMSKIFDGTNCGCKSEHTKMESLKVSTVESLQYVDFESFPSYRLWSKPAGQQGVLHGTAECIPSYLHHWADGSISIEPPH